MWLVGTYERYRVTFHKPGRMPIGSRYIADSPVDHIRTLSVVDRGQ